MLESGNYYDSELYETSGSKSSKYEGYVTSIAPNDEGDDDDDVGMPMPSNNGQAKRSFNPVAHAMKEIVQVRVEIRSISELHTTKNHYLQSEPDYDPFADHRRPTVGEKEDEYRQKRRRLVISPERVDPFADGTFRRRFLVVQSLLFIFMSVLVYLRDEEDVRFAQRSHVCLIVLSRSTRPLRECVCELLERHPGLMRILFSGATSGCPFCMRKSLFVGHSVGLERERGKL